MLGFVFISLLLTSCATTQKIKYRGTPEQIWQQREQRLKTLDNWELKGRIGLVSKRESGSASLYWKQQRDAYELDVVAPLGMGSLVVVGSENGVVLQSSDGELYWAEDAQWLVWQRTGWIIPMGSLKNWILGVPSRSEQYKLDDRGHVVQLSNESWQVEYLQYQQSDNFDLPRKLKISGPDIEIKLVIKNWRLIDQIK